MYPEDRYYSREHEWLRTDSQGNADEFVLGITDFAQDELGDVVFVELPAVGDSFDAGAEIGTIESVKAVAELFVPVAGTISAVNERIQDEPELLNSDPHGEGWLVRLAPSDPGAVGELMSAAQYEEFVKSGE